jgi:hypothetical protein
MHRLAEVQEAKDLMNEAMEWSAFRWLFEKPRVRRTADRANAALDHLNRSVKAHWSDEVKATYKKLRAKPGEAKHEKSQQPEEESTATEIEFLLEKVIAADHAAHRARMLAEEIFDEAEKQMNTNLAKEGCKKAILSWALHEKAIRSAEAISEKSHPPK